MAAQLHHVALNTAHFEEGIRFLKCSLKWKFPEQQVKNPNECSGSGGAAKSMR